ncbi:glucoamylase family protein [Candidatus Xianfuyuplasma coldseepsis]|uniref:Glycoamylase-like domain-containing protein n=1 Tax=Candidatus Xianfuyuplasma coldseepsis TaxID=2782163 RepID=A0A7L7KS28_9MOLU|nr:glucoamylase family protein [Xianfuyuplasma coldseepsis]QMS85062.1 hypothetical protein G4Z02_04660 [Xianfuyuplasma coldseepsis]
MKKITIIATLFIVLFLSACTKAEPLPECAANEVLQGEQCVRVYTEDEQRILQEMEASFNFFWELANTNEDSGGYGLINDRYPNNPNLSSIASVGFGLAAIPIGVEYGWITHEEGEERVIKTLETFENLDNYSGFFYHFLNKATGERAGTSEVSVIDTALFIAGAITAGEYFGGTAKTKADGLYAEIDWTWYIDPSNDQFYMGYRPESGFAGHWDFYAEQLILYVLGAGTPTEEYRIDKTVYDAFIRHNENYGDGEVFIHSWFGSLFTYQFSHAFVDFRNTEDADGVNWFENSIHATLANRNYAIDHNDEFSTFGENSWGMTASDGPSGYSGKYGAAPSGYNNASHLNDGTIPPAGALGSIVFTPEETIAAMNYFYTIEGLIGDYGFKDAYNFDIGTEVWIAEDSLGIDKGVTVLMLSNYLDETTWTYFMQSEYVQNGMERIEITPITAEE